MNLNVDLFRGLMRRYFAFYAVSCCVSGKQTYLICSECNCKHWSVLSLSFFLSLYTTLTMAQVARDLFQQITYTTEDEQSHGALQVVEGENNWTGPIVKRMESYHLSAAYVAWICHEHNSLPLGPIQPSSPSGKDLHGRAYDVDAPTCYLHS